MRILYITNGITASGGLERVLSIKASYFVDIYHYQVAIVTLNEKNKNPFYKFSKGIKVYNIEIHKKLDYFSVYFDGILSAVRDFNPDIISVCDDGLKGLYIPFWLRHGYKKIIYERHVSKMVSMNNKMSVKDKILSNLMSFGAKKFDKFVLLTEDNIKEWDGVCNKAVIPNPLSMICKEKSTVKNNQIIVVGRLEYQKGYDLLLNIWKNIEREFPNWKLKIYGKGSLKKEILDNINFLKLSNIELLDPIPDIEKAYIESSIYVMTSRYEGFGMVLIEAMCCGLPCIAFDCPCGPKEIIQNGKNGFLIPMNNLDLFERELKKLMSNYDLRCKMGEEAIDSIKKYLPEIVCEKWKNLFESLVK